MARKEYHRNCLAMYKNARSKQEMTKDACDGSAKAQKQMKKYDRGLRDVDLFVGNQVMLKLTPSTWEKVNRKLVHKDLVCHYDGSFTVLKQVGVAARRLDMPERKQVCRFS